jgi:uncharacterized protein YndB with AHSA1/START domain
MTAESLHLIVRRRIRAEPERLFEAWTTASELVAWWGPKGVRCTHAEVDARVGGHYRIGNALPDGRVLWISGEFLVVARPSKLVFTWKLEPSSADPEVVTVRFEAQAGGTEVIVVHERITNDTKRHEHRKGWEGCLDGLAALTAPPDLR